MTSMRDLLLIMREAISPSRRNRYWLNARTGEVVPAPDTHAIAVWKNPAMFGLDPDEMEQIGQYMAGDLDRPPSPNVSELDDDNTVAVRLALQKGWVRIAGVEPPHWMEPVVQAADAALAARGARWMAKEGLITDDLKVEIGYDDHARYADLSGDALDMFLKRGIVNALRESREGRPFIDSNVDGQTVEITGFNIPEGRQDAKSFYRQWEAALPSPVKVAKVWARHDVDFWESLGFDYCYTAADPEQYDADEDVWWWMHKGVNGNPTPRPELMKGEAAIEESATVPTQADLDAVRREYWDANTKVTFEPAFPLEYIPEVENRGGWFVREYKKALASDDTDLQADMELKFAGHDTRPVVLFVNEDGEVVVVADGNHRIGAALARGEETIPAYVGQDHGLDEKAPPGIKAKRFLRKAKKDFKKRYGDDWESRLYGTAWKLFGPKD